VSVKCLDKIQDWVSYTEIRKKLISVYVHKWFLRYSPRMCLPQSFRFLSVGILSNSSIQLQLKMKRHFTSVLLMSVRPLATSQGPLKGRSSLCCVQACMHSRWGMFWTCIVYEAFCQLWVKYYIVKECSFSVRLRNHSFPNIFLN
jgi:hypothetical protein